MPRKEDLLTRIHLVHRKTFRDCLRRSYGWANITTRKQLDFVLGAKVEAKVSRVKKFISTEILSKKEETSNDT